MASISRESNGRKTIQFVGSDGKRRNVRLGKVPMKVAQEVATKVEHLNAGIVAGVAMDVDTARWVAEIGDALARGGFDLGTTGQNKGGSRNIPCLGELD